MPSDLHWRHSFNAELDLARAARSAGNEGRARVCARRAVGVVLGEYFNQRHIPTNNPSAYDRLRLAERLPGMPENALPLIRHFLARVKPDYTLPGDIDLIAEAETLKTILLG